MAHSYTPGLKVSPLATLRRERKLPLPGDVLVAEGQRVTAETIVARTQLPGNVQAVNAANLSESCRKTSKSASPSRWARRSKKGRPSRRAAPSSALPLQVPRPRSRDDRERLEGHRTSVAPREPIPVEVDAYVDGTVVEVHPRSA